MDRADLRSRLTTFMEECNEEQALGNMRADNAYEIPQLHLLFDAEKAMSFGISMDDMYNTLNVAWAGQYVNDFIDRSRIKRVYLQSDAEFRAKPEDLSAWSVRNNSDLMVPYSEFTQTSWIAAPETLERFNGVAAYNVQGSANRGYSSGDAMQAVQNVVSRLPGTTFAWSGLSYQEQQASGQTVMLYTVSILVIFLCLAALYESWSIPLAVLLVIPLGLVGAVVGAHIRGLENNIYFQVALLTIIGLSARNAIMMVEFAEQAHKSGLSLTKAAIQAAILRLRPIVMTTLAFGAGVLPLALSTGVGANSRIAIGTGTLGGTISATFLTIFFIPLFFLLVSRIFGRKERSGGHA
jgi:multidrug efflux pump